MNTSSRAPESAPELKPEYRSSRCGKCYWALYDGCFCQNPDCEMSGQAVHEKRVHLTTTEAMILINHARAPQAQKEEPQWLPIASAPKDGTPILLSFDDRWPDVGYWFAGDQFGGWWVCHAVRVFPIAWMPIPPLPTPPKP